MDETEVNGISKGTKTVYRRYTKEQKGEFIKQWKNSGQSKRRFCEVNGLGYYSFIAWTTDPTKFPGQEIKTVRGFTELKVVPSTLGGETFAEVRTSDKVVLLLYREVSAAYLRKIIRG